MSTPSGPPRALDARAVWWAVTVLAVAAALVWLGLLSLGELVTALLLDLVGGLLGPVREGRIESAERRADHDGGEPGDPTGGATT